MENFNKLSRWLNDSNNPLNDPSLQKTLKSIQSSNKALQSMGLTNKNSISEFQKKINDNINFLHLNGGLSINKELNKFSKLYGVPGSPLSEQQRKNIADLMKISSRYNANPNSKTYTQNNRNNQESHEDDNKYVKQDLSIPTKDGHKANGEPHNKIDKPVDNKRIKSAKEKYDRRFNNGWKMRAGFSNEIPSIHNEYPPFYDEQIITTQTIVWNAITDWYSIAF